MAELSILRMSFDLANHFFHERLQQFNIPVFIVCESNLQLLVDGIPLLVVLDHLFELLQFLQLVSLPFPLLLHELHLLRSQEDVGAALLLAKVKLRIRSFENLIVHVNKREVHLVGVVVQLL